MKNSQNSAVQKESNLHTKRCLYCGQPEQLVWVHGHGQCAHCGTNVEECCRGESCFPQIDNSKA
ncbi:hypothetical protein CWD77_12180 [Rhodohalobacter barkolensis]|uniref:Uncharacterized protein n=1 Tax=Rhodohalobacter barkolensis TaxID=2053187 RepID=A0A2N0VGQ1_9BACT|nr:hypothetical protein CWD77_12180 [Rhodohalobacter barkolensis]